MTEGYTETFLFPDIYMCLYELINTNICIYTGQHTLIYSFALSDERAKKQNHLSTNEHVWCQILVSNVVPQKRESGLLREMSLGLVQKIDTIISMYFVFPGSKKLL